MKHEALLQKVVAEYKQLDGKRKPRSNKDYEVFVSIINKPGASPFSHADFLGISRDQVTQITRYFGLNSKDKRERVLQDVASFLNLVRQCLEGEENARSQYKAFTAGLTRGYSGEFVFTLRSFYLLALIKLCADKKYHRFFAGSSEWMPRLTAVDAKNFFRDLMYEIDKGDKTFHVDNIRDIIQESMNGESGEAADEEAREESDKIQELEFKLETTQSTLIFIQRSLDDMVANLNQQAEALKREVVTNFFTTVNSAKYGRLLDNSVLVEKRLDVLRHEKYRFPVEVMAMPIMIKNLLAFIRAYGFETIKEAGTMFEAASEDLLYVDYDGEPFIGDERKLVEVVSPGWKRGDIIISKPVVREVVDAAGQ